MESPLGKLVRWRVKLQKHNFDIIYKNGKFNIDPDALSRAPLSNLNDSSIKLDILNVELETLDPYPVY